MSRPTISATVSGPSGNRRRGAFEDSGYAGSAERLLDDHGPSLAVGMSLRSLLDASDGADVDHVGGRQQHYEQPQGVQAVPVLDVARQPFTGDVADPAAGLPHPDDQRQHPQRGPQLPIAELRAGLGIGRDARRVIIGRPGNPAPDPGSRADAAMSGAGCRPLSVPFPAAPACLAEVPVAIVMPP